MSQHKPVESAREYQALTELVSKLEEISRRGGEREFFRLFDSLARFYNSQITSHVGYALTTMVFIGASAIAILLQILINSQLSWILKFEAVMAIAFGIMMYLSVESAPFFFPYLYGRAQYYIALSGIVWEHMEFLEGPSRPPQPHAQRLRERVLQFANIPHAITTLFEARLFVSRCLRKGVRFDDPRIGHNLQFFDITQDELPLTAEERYYDKRILWLWNLADLIYLAYKRQVEQYCRLPNKPNFETLRRRGWLLKEPSKALDMKVPPS